MIVVDGVILGVGVGALVAIIVLFLVLPEVLGGL